MSNYMASQIYLVKIGNWNVKCYIPTSDQFQIGVISPIDVKENLNCIDNFKTDNQAKIIKMERITRNNTDGTKTPTTTVKITFETTVLPQYIKLFHFNYKVRPYVPYPMQCFKCQRMGHTISSCNATRARCLLCSGNHFFKDCKNTANLYCANCNRSSSC